MTENPNTSYGRKKTAQLKRCEIRIDKKLGEAAEYVLNKVKA